MLLTKPNKKDLPSRTKIPLFNSGKIPPMIIVGETKKPAVLARTEGAVTRPWRIWDRKEIIKAVMARTEAVEEEETMKNTIKIRPAPPPIL